MPPAWFSLCFPHTCTHKHSCTHARTHAHTEEEEGQRGECWIPAHQHLQFTLMPGVYGCTILSVQVLYRRIVVEPDSLAVGDMG